MSKLTSKPCPFCHAPPARRSFGFNPLWACSNIGCQASTGWTTPELWNARPYEAKLQDDLLKEEARRSELQSYVDQLELWIKEEGNRTSSCTFDILRRQCEGCRCPRFSKESV